MVRRHLIAAAAAAMLFLCGSAAAAPRSQSSAAAQRQAENAFEFFRDFERTETARQPPAVEAEPAPAPVVPSPAPGPAMAAEASDPAAVLEAEEQAAPAMPAPAPVDVDFATGALSLWDAKAMASEGVLRPQLRLAGAERGLDSLTLADVDCGRIDCSEQTLLFRGATDLVDLPAAEVLGVCPTEDLLETPTGPVCRPGRLIATRAALQARAAEERAGIEADAAAQRGLAGLNPFSMIVKVIRELVCYATQADVALPAAPVGKAGGIALASPATLPAVMAQPPEAPNSPEIAEPVPGTLQTGAGTEPSAAASPAAAPEKVPAVAAADKEKKTEPEPVKESAPTPPTAAAPPAMPAADLAAQRQDENDSALPPKPPAAPLTAAAAEAEEKAAKAKEDDAAPPRPGVAPGEADRLTADRIQPQDGEPRPEMAAKADLPAAEAADEGTEGKKDAKKEKDQDLPLPGAPAFAAAEPSAKGDSASPAEPEDGAKGAGKGGERGLEATRSPELMLAIAGRTLLPWLNDKLFTFFNCDSRALQVATLRAAQRMQLVAAAAAAWKTGSIDPAALSCSEYDCDNLFVVYDKKKRSLGVFTQEAITADGKFVDPARIITSAAGARALSHASRSAAGAALRGAGEAKPAKVDSAAAVTGGKYYALVVGIDKYKNIGKLANAVNDARGLAAMLQDRYGFETRLILDEKATRDNVMRALNELRRTLAAEDSLLIYYSGHGIYDQTTDTSYWLPVDAEPDDTTRWLDARSITDQLKLFASRHVLVVADSCFSGTMTRSAATSLSQNTTRDNYLKKLLEKPSRVLIASGGNEPVTDAGGKGHSIFTDVLLRALDDPFAPVFTAEELMARHLKESVAGRTAQTPEYRIIRNSGHDGGDFVFVRQVRD